MKSIAAVLLAMGVAAAAPMQTPRFAAYIKWCKHYQQLMGIQDEHYTYVRHYHPLYCAWVSTKDAPPGFYHDIEVGISEPDFECGEISTRVLALHEMCHIRMKHLMIPESLMSDDQKHAEVDKCMIAYREREQQ